MDLLSRVRDAGVIGAGGAGFPTHVKLKAQAEYVLLNGAECEPLLRVDQQLMAVHPREILQGLMAGMELTGAAKGIVGIKESHPDVIAIMRDAARDMHAEDRISIGVLPDVYPAGDEQVLVHELTGRIVPENAIPIAVGCVVMNAETTYNVYKASCGEPVTMKYVTVAGCVPHPVTVRVPVGTPLSMLFAYAGMQDMSGFAVINGGPMMGPLLGENDLYVTKKTKGLVVLPEDHGLIIKKKQGLPQAKRLNRSACEQCRMCTDLCPRHLLGHSTSPHKMVRAMAFGLEGTEKMSAALTCCQCNLCEYFACPAGIHPRLANVYYMNQLREKGIRHTPRDHYETDPLRPYRMIPSRRLIAHLGLMPYNTAAPLEEEPAMTPELVGIGLKDHVGAPAQLLVRAGEHVQAGQKIAKIPEGALGAAVHASISGTVEAADGNLVLIRRD